jgi:hypothetical protein
MTKEFERKDIVPEVHEVPALSDGEKFDSRGNVPAVTGTNSNAVILTAMQNNYTPELIEKMMALQERNDANEARKLYVAAMAAFKANPPAIEKDKTVEYDVGSSTTKYSHASLANAAEKINKALSAHQLSASWKTTQDNGNITVTCSITHAAGHSESTGLTAGPDKTGSKNSIQAIGSTISYLQRYTLLALTGLAAHDMDTDGITTKSEPEFITEAQQKQLTKDLKHIYGSDSSMFFEWIGVETVDTILASDMPKIKKGLGTARKAKTEAVAKSEREPGE